MRRSLVGLVALVAVLGGCTANGSPVPEESVASPFAACPPAAAMSPAPTAAGELVPAPAAAGELVPDLRLPCFTGDAPVSLRQLGKPALINLWASSCGPCRDEMPVLQAFATAAGDRVVVLGVVTADRRAAAAWAGADFGVTYPSVWDPDRQLLKALGRNVIPITLFVDAAGVVRHLDTSGALNPDELRALALEHLGVST